MNVESYFDDYPGRDWQSATGTDRLRFAVVGLGCFAVEWALPAIERADTRVASVVVSVSDATAARVGREFGTARQLSYEEFHDGVARDVYDAVYVCTPNARHLPVAETAAGLGKHILCKKPLERSFERAERIREVCQEAGVTLMTAYRMQFDPAIRPL